MIELLFVVAIAGIVFLAITGVVSGSLQARQYSREHNQLTHEARFAMERMVSAVSRTERLLLPLAENPGTAWSESVRDPGVLAVTLDPGIDRDSDGYADGDNDKDGLIDEDVNNDNTNDGAHGIVGIDDDNDGSVDEGGMGPDGFYSDNDEDGSFKEDEIDGIDKDGDGAIDEDFPADMNKDGQPGISGVDDDGDATVDEGSPVDDDEDGTNNEDWLDAVVYYLAGSKLMERMPNINPVDGTDYTESIIANYVTGFRIERLVSGAKKPDLIDIKLTLQDSLGDPVLLTTRVRVGAGW